MDTHEKQHAALENNITAQASKTVQSELQTFLQRIITVSFVVQAALIGVIGNRDVLSGKSPLDVVPWMVTQGVELILKAHRAQKSLQERDAHSKDLVPRKSRSNK
jgi:hypothetical protein